MSNSKRFTLFRHFFIQVVVENSFQLFNFPTDWGCLSVQKNKYRGKWWWNIILSWENIFNHRKTEKWKARIAEKSNWIVESNFFKISFFYITIKKNNYRLTIILLLLNQFPQDNQQWVTFHLKLLFSCRSLLAID